MRIFRLMLQRGRSVCQQQVARAGESEVMVQCEVSVSACRHVAHMPNIVPYIRQRVIPCSCQTSLQAAQT